MSQSSGHGISSGDLNTGDNLSESSFLFLVPQISQNSTDLCPMRAGISQIKQMTQIFFASHLSPITIFRYKFDKMLIAKEFVCVTDGLKWGFIPHVSLTIWALSLTILLMLLSKKAFLRLKLASLAFGVSFISNWFGAQIKFTWGSVKVYLSLTSDSNEAQFDFFHVLQMNHKGL